MLRLNSNAGFTAFSPTYILDSNYLGRRQAGLKVFRCRCQSGRLFRVRRRMWMRAIPLMRLYQCARCGCKVLRLRLRAAKGARYPL